MSWKFSKTAARLLQLRVTAKGVSWTSIQREKNWGSGPHGATFFIGAAAGASALYGLQTAAADLRKVLQMAAESDREQRLKRIEEKLQKLDEHLLSAIPGAGRGQAQVCARLHRGREPARAVHGHRQEGRPGDPRADRQHHPQEGLQDQVRA